MKFPIFFISSISVGKVWGMYYKFGQQHNCSWWPALSLLCSLLSPWPGVGGRHPHPSEIRRKSVIWTYPQIGQDQKGLLGEKSAVPKINQHQLRSIKMNKDNQGQLIHSRSSNINKYNSKPTKITQDQPRSTKINKNL